VSADVEMMKKWAFVAATAASEVVGSCESGAVQNGTSSGCMFNLEDDSSFFPKLPWGLSLPSPPAYYDKLLLFAYCVVVVKNTDPVLTRVVHRNNPVMSFLTSVLAGFGGSLITPALLGLQAPPVVDPKLLMMMLLAWILYHNTCFGKLWQQTVNDRLADSFLKAGFEIFRCFVMFSWYKKSYALMETPRSRILAPIICGTLGSCGGAFLPFSKGLTPLEAGVPWNAESSFYAMVFYHGIRNAFDPTPLDLENLQLAICLAMVFCRVFPSMADIIVSPIRYLLRGVCGLAFKLPEDAAAAHEKQD